MSLQCSTFSSNPSVLPLLNPNSQCTKTQKTSLPIAKSKNLFVRPSYRNFVTSAIISDYLCKEAHLGQRKKLILVKERSSSWSNKEAHLGQTKKLTL
jgi:hypothetical protein